MAKAKAEEILRKQKEAKQKKLLFVLVPIFLLLMVWQGPGYIKMLTGGEEPAAAPAEETPTTTTADGSAVPDPSVAPAPTTTAPGGTPEGTPTGTAVALTDSDVPASAEAGELVSFERFVGKDPFRQLVETSAETAGTTDGGPVVTPTPVPGGSGSGSGGSGSGGGDDGSGGDDDGGPATATLEVNGAEEVVKVKDEFPEGEKLFVLAEIGAKSIRVGLVTGEFSTGKGTIEIKLGKTLNLVSQPDGIRYTIKLLSVDS